MSCLYFPPAKAEFIYPHLLRAETKIATDNEIQALLCLLMRHIQLDDAQRCMDANAAAETPSRIGPRRNAVSLILTEEFEIGKVLDILSQDEATVA